MAANLPSIFTNADDARAYLESQRWPDGPVCPHCGTVNEATALNGKAHRAGVYQCNACREQFTVTVGTVFERSKIRSKVALCHAPALLVQEGHEQPPASPHVGRHLQDRLVHDAPHP